MKHYQRIQEFAEKYLDGNLDNIADFRLTKLKNDKVFGCYGRSFDPDDTEIMRCIYVALFADAWPGLSLDTLKSGVFRGDTLNTYNTLFGRPDQQSPHPGLDRFGVSNDLRLKIASFQDTFPLIGNMTVVPNIRVGRNSINTYRGCHYQWRDYFDRFLNALHTILANAHPVDNGLAELIDANKIYFSLYKGQDGFSRLVEALMLSDYVDTANRPIINSKGYYFWKKGLTSEEYEKEAYRYITFSNRVIQNRTALMIGRLKDILESCVHIL